MKRTSLVVLIGLAFVVQSAWVLYSQTAKPPGPLTTARVAGDLHMISGEGGNVALYVTGEGVVLVDDMFDRNHDDILKQVKAVTDKPLRYVFNTHQHDDHAGGDMKMLRIAEVIAHKNVRANLLDIKQPYYEDTPGTPIGIPRMTFDDEMAVHLGTSEVRAYYFGRGHTRGDAIIHFPRERAIHTGDLFLNFRAQARPGAPPRPPGVPVYVDSAQGGSFIEWSRTLDRTLALDFDTVIPGHGPVARKADLAQFAANLATMRGRLTDLIRKGTSKADLAKVLEDDYGWRSTGCPPSPPTGGCLQYQQLDALIAELRAGAPQASVVPVPPARQVAITIDDLPRGGDQRGGGLSLDAVLDMTRRLLTPFRDQRVPVTGFVNQGRQAGFDLKGLRQVLDVWLDFGSLHRSHTRDQAGDAGVPRRPWVPCGARDAGQRRLPVRGPVHEARVPRARTTGIRALHGVRGGLLRGTVRGGGGAGVSADPADPREPAERRPDAGSAGDVRRRGYTFVSLEQALADPAYRLEDGYAGRNGFSWIHRWSRTKGLKPKGEPHPPAWVSAWSQR